MQAGGTSPVAIALARRMLWQMVGDGDLAKAHEAESEAIHFLGSSAEVREGVASFLEKRDAAFPLRVSRDMPDFFGRWQAQRGGLTPSGDRPVRGYDRLPRAR